MKPLVLVFAIFCLLLVSIPSGAQTFVLNGVTHCGGNLTNPGADVHFNLAAGTHNIEWVSGPYSLWSSNGENGGNTWIGVARAYVYATAETFTFGNIGGGFFATNALAEAGALGVRQITLSTAEGAGTIEATSR